MTQMQFYDYVFTPLQVIGLFLNCIGNEGNIVAWPDALGRTIGEVQVVRPQSLCKPCPELNFDERFIVTPVVSC